MTPAQVTPWIARLYPERDSALFVRVQVWPTKKTFLKHLNEEHYSIDGRGFGARTEGVCSRHESYRIQRGRPQRRSPCVAEVNLWRRKITMRVVTHEMFHATIAWGHRVGFPFAALTEADGVTRTEERITYVHGNLCSDFVDRALKAGLYEDGDLCGVRS